ncbi:MAG TPA: diaminopimelate epimerase, partial [Vicinamibacterales bacterium]|nr:diaminopimelate epimerase [Vicinamibacterales bacterium]
MNIIKAHAYGNDFLFADRDAVAGHDLAALARQLCARHTGIGADGLILYSFTADGATMRLINADGSASELSGNGLRCLAAIVMRERERHHGAPAATPTVVRAQTDAGERRLTLTSRSDGRYLFRADMGHPTAVAQETLEVAGERVPVVTLNIGNPQVVALMAALPDRARFNRLGPGLATHPRFPAGTNVEFAVVERPDLVNILIWERGVGPTEASGTGACAAAIAAMTAGGAARDVNVVAPGGTQRVEWTDAGVFL